MKLVHIVIILSPTNLELGGLSLTYLPNQTIIIREGFKKKNNNFHGIFHGRGYPPSIQIINFLKKKIGPLQTVINGLKHEKKSINFFYHIMTTPRPPHTHTVSKIMGLCGLQDARQ